MSLWHRMGLESQFPELLDVRDPEPSCAELLDPDGDRSRWLEAVPCQSQRVPVGALPLDRPFLGCFCWCLPAALPGPAAQLVLDAVGRSSGQSCSSGLCGGKAGGPACPALSWCPARAGAGNGPSRRCLWRLAGVGTCWLPSPAPWCRCSWTQTCLPGFFQDPDFRLLSVQRNPLVPGFASVDTHCLFCNSLVAFYTSKYGYKMCLRVYLNGDGTGRGTHLSLFFVVMKGPNDALLRWPFNQKVGLGQSPLCPAVCPSGFTPTGASRCR